MPYYPPIDCTQNGCDEFAESAIVLIKTDESEPPMICTLCKEHTDVLLKLKELDIPVEISH